MVPIFNGILVVLVTVNWMGVLLVPTFVVGKVNAVCERLTPVAVPFRSTVMGLAGSLLITLTPPSRVPDVVGA